MHKNTKPSSFLPVDQVLSWWEIGTIQFPVIELLVCSIPVDEFEEDSEENTSCKAKSHRECNSDHLIASLAHVIPVWEPAKDVVSIVALVHCGQDGR